MYESPIEVIQKNIEMQIENGIYKAVQNVGINVDKEELIKALNYDRRQYQKGYADGFRDAHAPNVIRCKDCIYSNGTLKYCSIDHWVNEDGTSFCSYGEKSEPSTIKMDLEEVEE